MKQNERIRQSMVVSAILLAALFLLPMVVVTPFRPGLFSGETPVDETEGETFTSGALDADIILKVLDGDEVSTMDLGAYLVGVVRAEMPAAFELEALKAQATAARTYTLYKMCNGGNHGETADICTDSTCCQAYLSEAEAKTNWGENAGIYEEKIEKAVTDTDGQTILYEGTPILAVFHSSSAGLTRTADAVWVNALPYLQAVQSPEVGETIPNYYSRAEFTAAEFKKKIQEVYPEAELSDDRNRWLSNAVTDDGGNVETVNVGGVTVKGSELRRILGLRSACFEWEVQGENLVFFVTGYGHGVGLSQYGANQMAAEGADYREILTHYYTGVTVEPYLYKSSKTVLK